MKKYMLGFIFGVSIALMLPSVADTNWNPNFKKLETQMAEQMKEIKKMQIDLKTIKRVTKHTDYVATDYTCSKSGYLCHIAYQD